MVLLFYYKLLHLNLPAHSS